MSLKTNAALDLAALEGATVYGTANTGSHSEANRGTQGPSNPVAREKWLRRVLRATAPGRRARFREYKRRAAHYERMRDSSRAKWWNDRANGQLQRGDMVLQCGSKKMVLRCRACGSKQAEPKPATCSAVRYCLSCRSKKCIKGRFRLDEGIAKARARYRAELARRFGAYSEKLLTLTVPHSGDVRLDLALLHAAWKRLFRRVRLWQRVHHFLSKEQARALPYARVHEVTASDEGHAHCHAWLLGPYISNIVLRSFWGRAIVSAQRELGIVAGTFEEQLAVAVPSRSVAELRADIESADISEHRKARELDELASIARFRNRELARVPWPVLDIRRCKGEVGAELCKYLLKDTVGTGSDSELLAPELYAQLIEATEGRRLMATSRRLLAEDPGAACKCCQVVGALRVDGYAEDPSLEAPTARGPPAFVHTEGVTVLSPPAALTPHSDFGGVSYHSFPAGLGRVTFRDAL